MSIFEQVKNFFSPSSKSNEMVLLLAVKCQRCGDIIQTRINLRNDLSAEYDDRGQPTYFCRKELMSSKGLCFQRIEIELTFDANRHLIHKEARGGIFVDLPDSK